MVLLLQLGLELEQPDLLVRLHELPVFVLEGIVLDLEAVVGMLVELCLFLVQICMFLAVQ